MMRRVVDLPQPDGPTSTTSSPSGNVRSSGRRAGLCPSKLFVTPASRISATVGDKIARGEPGQDERKSAESREEGAAALPKATCEEQRRSDERHCAHGE